MDNIDAIMAEEFAAEKNSKKENIRDEDSDNSGLADTDEPLPQLPDGIGLDFEDVRMMLSKKHGIMLGREEPIMMMVTLCNVLLGELEKVHKNHNEAVTKIMSDQSAKYIVGVKATTDALSKTLAENSVEAIRNIFQSQAAALNTNKINARWCAAVVGVSALANIVVMAFSVWR